MGMEKGLAVAALSTAALVGCATDGLGFGQPVQATRMPTSSPAPVSYQIKGSPCPSEPVNNFPDANRAFQTCAYPHRGVELIQAGTTFTALRVYDLGNPQQNAAYSRAFDNAARVQERADNQAVRNAQRNSRQDTGNVIIDNARVINRTTREATGTVNSVNGAARAVKRILDFNW